MQSPARASASVLRRRSQRTQMPASEETSEVSSHAPVLPTKTFQNRDAVGYFKSTSRSFWSCVWKCRGVYLRTKLNRVHLVWISFGAFSIAFISLQIATAARGNRWAWRNIRMLGIGADQQSLTKRGIVPWELAGTGSDPSRDRLVKWWVRNPDAPMGLSCAAFDSFLEGGGDENGDQLERVDQPEVGKEGENRRGKTDHQKKNKHEAQLSLKREGKRRVAANSADDTYFYKGFGISPPIFKGRMPETGSQRVQVAFVLPFVEFQLIKVATLLSEFWTKFPPCQADSPRQSADLVFFTENKLSESIQRRIRSFYSELGSSKTGCFRTNEPVFLSIAETDANLSHLEGAAITFYSLFRLLEKNYKTFLLAEPDVAPVQPNFLPALVQKSLTVNCEADGFWQVGSPPLAKDIDVAMLRERLDFHMNGNAIYVLGCPEFEEYKCRVQTFYVPKGDCKLVAGCQTHEAYEGGYDHAMYRFRMHPENYEYSRLILHKFAYSYFIQNRGEGVYDPAEIVQESPSTYFVHSKSIYQNDAATTLQEVASRIISLVVKPMKHMKRAMTMFL